MSSLSWCFTILLSTLALVDIDLTQHYTLTNPLLTSSRSLASTQFNESLLVVSSSSSSDQQWFFTSTSVTPYYRLHTVAKDENVALDVDNYNGRNAIDMHFYYVQERSGQYWMLDEQDDGSIKISNNYTGPDVFLDVGADSLKPTLRAADGKGTRWTLNGPGATASPSASSALSSSVSATTMISSVSRTGSASPTSACTSACSASSTALESDGDSGKASPGKIAGIAVGAVAGLTLVGAIAWYALKKHRESRGRDVDSDGGPTGMSSMPFIRA